MTAAAARKGIFTDPKARARQGAGATPGFDPLTGDFVGLPQLAGETAEQHVARVMAASRQAEGLQAKAEAGAAVLTDARVRHVARDLHRARVAVRYEQAGQDRFARFRKAADGSLPQDLTPHEENPDFSGWQCEACNGQGYVTDGDRLLGYARYACSGCGGDGEEI